MLLLFAVTSGFHDLPYLPGPPALCSSYSSSLRCLLPHKVSSTSLRIQSKSQNAEGAWEAGVWSCVPAMALLSLRVLGFPGTPRCLVTSVTKGLNQSGRNRWYWGNELPALYSPAPGLFPSSLAGKKRPVITNLRSTNHPQWLLALGDLQAQSSFSYLT